MSFIFTENQTFEWPVKVCVPNGGSYDEVAITGIFELVDDNDFFADTTAPATQSQAISLEIDRLMMVFKGWKDGDVLDLQKQPVGVTPENIRKFLGGRPARLAVTAAYSDAITPTSGFRAKN